MEYMLEQTICPHCQNDIGNIVLADDEDVLHRGCGKCNKHYVVSRPTKRTADEDAPRCDGCGGALIMFSRYCHVCGRPHR